MTGRSSRRRGIDYERSLVAHMASLGIPAERTAIGRAQRDGDVDGIPNVHIEAKSHRSLDLAGWLDQAVRQAAPGRLPMVVVKRRGVGDVGRSYAVCELDTLLVHLGVIDGGGTLIDTDRAQDYLRTTDQTDRLTTTSPEES